MGASIPSAPFKAPSFQDKFLSLTAGSPEDWRFARNLLSQLDENDVIYCPGEDIGIPMAAFFAAKQNRPRIVTFAHNIDRPRGRLSLKLLRVLQATDLFLVCSLYQKDFLCKYLNLPESRVRFIWDKVDLNFFTPGAPTADKKRPLITSVGLENRDYRLIAAATEDMDVDVRISGFSKYAQQLQRAFPDVLPANMTRQFYPWHELVQLYRDADIVVVSTFESKYASGVSSLLEAMACRRPIIATETEGLAAYLDPEIVLTVKPGDVDGLKKAITYLLNHPEEASRRAELGYQVAKARNSIDTFTDQVVACLRQPKP
ncbi:glycosyltransferase family 4 protein [Pseudanabaena sp. FACHB-2040]|nr:glycosyltransferase family 4 protein [Pseudanabaena sp. FACHB-2040]